MYTHELKSNDFNDVNVIFAYAIFWLIFKNVVFRIVSKKWWKTSLSEEFLDPLACESEHESLVILIF